MSKTVPYSHVSATTLAALKELAAKPLASATTMPKDMYVSPSIFQLEIERLFHGEWICAGRTDEIPNSGDYMSFDLCDQPLILVRGKDGDIHAMSNVCRHRMMRLVDGLGTAKKFTCPYHAWVYGLHGRLTRARRSELIENFDTQKICLDSVRVEVFCHLVFINLDPDAPELAKQTGSLSEEIMSYAPDLASLTYAHTLTYRIKANWKAVVDNFLECYHCPVAHRDFCTLVEMDTYKVKTHGIYSSHMAKAGRGDNQAYGVDSASVTDHAVWYLWPNTTLMRYPGRGNFMVWRFYPDGPEQTYEVFDFFFETDTPNESEWEAIRFIDEVLQPEDIGLVESVQRGMQTPAFNQGRYLVDPDGSGLSEHAVHHFHGLVLDAYRGAI